MTVLTGFNNGRAKLTDDEVAALRAARAASLEDPDKPIITFYRLAKIFKISQPQAIKICKGQSRKSAPGPIEGLRFGTKRDAPKTVKLTNGRCSGCGAKITGAQCRACQLRQPQKGTAQ